MKPIPAIVEPADSEVALAAVRSTSSALREAEVQVQKIGKRLEAAEGAVALRKLELGRALNAAHELWPSAKAAQGGARGPRGQTWEQFLESEGIAKSTAYRLMEDAGGSSQKRELGRPVDNTGPRLVPDPPAPPADDDFDPTPQPPAALPRPGFSLLLGDWRSVLIDAGMVDVLICDPPYGARTHNSKPTRNDGSDPDGLAPEYAAWTSDDVAMFVKHWSHRTRGWIVALTSYDLITAWEEAFVAADRYSFAPVPCVISGMSVRLQGDGPSSWAVYAMVGRPRTGEFSRWGTLPGAYTGGREPGAEGGRGKPSWLMRALVRDYSRPGDRICDPLAGYGATLIAALDEGRRCIGAELDHGAYDEAYRRAAQRASDTTDTNT